MKRELKFRAWIHADCGGGVPQECFNTMAYSENDSLEDFFSQFENFFDIMQYTGLKDKNGKEIYEGDIVTYPNKKCFGVITFGEYEFGDYDTYQSGCGFYIDSENTSAQGYFHPPIIEIIGNIHENPELLKRLQDIKPN